MSKSHPEEGLFASPENVSAATRELDFIVPFDGGFRAEPEVNIIAAPHYLRAMMVELQMVQSMAWVRGLGDNRTGEAARVFDDGSMLEAHIVYTPTIPDDIAGIDTEISINIGAFVGPHSQREAMYEIRHGEDRVIRTDIKEDVLGANDPKYELPTDDPEEMQEIVAMEVKEAAVLRAGGSLEGEVAIEALRNASPYFKQISDEQRRLYANRAFARQMGLNEQPVGIGELSSLRQAILSQ